MARARLIGTRGWLGVVVLGWLASSCGHAPSAADASVAVESTEPAAVQGRVRAHDGSALLHGHVRLRVPGHADATVQAPVAADGTVALATTHEGFAWLDINGVDHAPLTMAVVLGSQPLRLDVRLGTNSYRDRFDELRLQVVRGDGTARYVRATARADGAYEAVLDTGPGRVEYAWSSALSGCCGATVAGTVRAAGERARWVPDGEGQYRAVRILGEGPQRFVFDPRQLPPAGHGVQIRHEPSQGPAARVAAIAADVAEAQRRYFDELRTSAMRNGSQAAQRTAVEYPWAERMESMAARAMAETDPAVERLAWAAYFARPASAEPTPREREVAGLVLERISPVDPVWDFGHMTALLRAAEGQPGAEAWAQRAIDEHPADEVVAQVLLARAASTTRTDVQRGADRRVLRTARFRDTSAAHRLAVLAVTEPEQRRPLPAFELAALDGPAPISSASLRGRSILISFWATWCEPCVDEMPALHELHERSAANGSGPEIVSVAVGDDREAIEEFRRQRWPMPWRHAKLDGTRKDALWAALGLQSLPAAVLVDAQGRIVAAGGSRRVLNTIHLQVDASEPEAVLSAEGVSPETLAEIRREVEVLEALAATAHPQ